MKVILLKNLSKVGKEGDIKEVADGYALNYLMPMGIARQVSDLAIMQMANKANNKVKKENKEIEKGKRLLKEIGNLKLKIKAKANPEGKLFAAVSKDEIVQEFKNKKVIINAAQIEVEKPIKEIGDHFIKIVPAKGVSSDLKISVIADQSV